jgi:RNA polymerase sigma-70 factor (ECF subfamily)
VTADWDVRVEPTQATATDLRRALNRLPNEERDAFLLAEVGGLTYTEIAAAIDSTVAAVRSRIYRARLSLRDQLMPPAPIQSATVSMREDDD